MYKINHNLVPDYLTKIFPSTRSHDSIYTTRQQQNYSIPKCRLNIYFVPTAIHLWNGIPLEIRNLPTLKSFKKSVLSSKSQPPSYFSYGERYWNVIHTIQTSLDEYIFYCFHYRNINRIQYVHNQFFFLSMVLRTDLILNFKTCNYIIIENLFKTCSKRYTYTSELDYQYFDKYWFYTQPKICTNGLTKLSCIAWFRFQQMHCLKPI